MLYTSMAAATTAEVPRELPGGDPVGALTWALGANVGNRRMVCTCS